MQHRYTWWHLVTRYMLLVIVLGAVQLWAQRGLTLTVDGVPFLYPLNGIMHWTGGRLAGCDSCVGKPVLWAVDRQGNRKAVELDIPGAGYVQARDVSAGTDGSLAAVGFAISDDSRTGTFLAWIAADASHQVITRVWPYSPQVVTVAPDGSVWTVGAMMNDNHRTVHPNVLRHYTPAGQLLGSTIVQGVRKSNTGIYEVSAGSELMASNDRIGWLTGTLQYFEFSFEAVQLGTYNCPNLRFTTPGDLPGIALSSENDVLIGTQWQGPLSVLELDRPTGTWKPVPVRTDSGKTQRLLGFDGLTLVTSAGGTSASMRRYDWSAALPAANQ